MKDYTGGVANSVQHEDTEWLDRVLTRQVRNITIGVVAVVVARNLSQAVAMTITDVSRRLVDLKLPMKWV